MRDGDFEKEEGKIVKDWRRLKKKTFNIDWRNKSEEERRQDEASEREKEREREKKKTTPCISICGFGK